MKELALRCDCIGGEHYILITAFEEPDEYELFFDVITDTDRFSLWKKLQLCWQLLSGRKVSEDCVLLKQDKAEQLRDFINDYLLKLGE